MSYFTLEPNQHDLNTALAILDIKKNYPNIILVAADGGFPFEDIIVADTPVILGYKPDAICSDDKTVRLLEIKSVDDLYSTHTKEQFSRLTTILNTVKEAYLELYVFGDGHVPHSSTIALPINSFTIRRFYEGAVLEY